LRSAKQPLGKLVRMTLKLYYWKEWYRRVLSFQQQLHMNLEGNEDVEEQEQEEHQLLNVELVQSKELPDNRAYLDGGSTVTALKTSKYLHGIKTALGGIKISCNAGMVSTNQIGTYKNLNMWYIPENCKNLLDA
jgi:hypothetical protein